MFTCFKKKSVNNISKNKRDEYIIFGVLPISVYDLMENLYLVDH